MTKLNGKKLTRVIEIGGKEVIVVLSDNGLSFRLKNKRDDVFIAWKQVFGLYGLCGNINRPVKAVLGLRPK